MKRMEEIDWLMPPALPIIGLALLVLAAAGPRFGLKGAAPRKAASDQRQVTVLILRILAALLGLWLLIFSAVHLLRGYGHISPASTQQS